jgi:hypothetical protein
MASTLVRLVSPGLPKYTTRHTCGQRASRDRLNRSASQQLCPLLHWTAWCVENPHTRPPSPRKMRILGRATPFLPLPPSQPVGRSDTTERRRDRSVVLTVGESGRSVNRGVREREPGVSTRRFPASMIPRRIPICPYPRCRRPGNRGVRERFSSNP